MAKFNNKYSLSTYYAAAAIIVLLGFCILGKAFYTMTAKKSYWMEVASFTKKDSVLVKPIRGNILSSNGEMMASSLPEYKLYMDFKALKDAKNDTIFIDSIDYICKG